MQNTCICCHCGNELKKGDIKVIVSKEKTLCDGCHKEYVDILNAFLSGKEVNIVKSKQTLLVV